MSSTTEHKEVQVKVNVWVDSGVAPLVKALSLFAEVETLNSCEGTKSEDAYIYFRCCDGSRDARPRETCEFVIWLSSALRSHPNPCTDYRLRLEWWNSEEPMAQIITYRENVVNLANKLTLLSGSQPKLG